MKRDNDGGMTLSIIIPAYNAAEFIEATIHSALAVVPRVLEVIVIDDGSTDGTRAICSSFGGAIRYRRVENGGVSRARNIGAEMALGEWFLFLDADDLLLPDAVELLLDSAQRHTAFVAYGQVIERAAPGGTDRINGFDYIAGNPPHRALNGLYRGVIITPGAAVVRKSLHERVGGFVTGYEPMEDRDYWLKCGLLEGVAYLPVPVLDKTWRPSSHGSQHAKRIYRGQIAQRALRNWCQERGIDSSILPSDQVFLKKALDEAIDWKCWEILEPLLAEAENMCLGHWRGKFMAFLHRDAAPGWINIKPEALNV
jgi:glycosyltransferase involved in cell wall biosynthesis